MVAVIIDVQPSFNVATATVGVVKIEFVWRYPSKAV
jgi:hypothetical protein